MPRSFWKSVAKKSEKLVLVGVVNWKKDLELVSKEQLSWGFEADYSKLRRIISLISKIDIENKKAYNKDVWRKLLPFQKN